MISYTETPIQEIDNPALRAAGVRLLVKREDLNHPIISGNKWWKLKYNLGEALNERAGMLLTFGGAYSNHIVAVAEAAAHIGMKSIGIIRGENREPLNPALRFARAKGMQLHFISREQYKTKTDSAFIERLRQQFGAFYLIPEGGTNELAVRGTRDWGEKLVREIDFDVVALAVGTGGTIAGIVQALRPGQRAIGISVLKGGDFLVDEVRKWVGHERNWTIETRFHFGGFAKASLDLHRFIDEQMRDQKLPLDPVYTAKALYGILELIRRKEIVGPCTVLMIHTGGFSEAAIT